LCRIQFNYKNANVFYSRNKRFLEKMYQLRQHKLNICLEREGGVLCSLVDFWRF